jgi:CHAT domain-containing protein
LHALAPGTATPEAGEARARLARALEEEREARARIAASQRRLAHFVPEEPPADLAAVAAALPKGTLLLLYHLGEEACHVLAVPGAAAERARLVALPRDGFEKRIDGWLELVATAAAPEANLSRELGRALLDPLAAELREAERVVVSPDRELAFLPFEALRWSDGSGEPRRLIETCEVAYVPSATVLLRLRAQTEGVAPGLGALALGDPVYGTLDPASGAEAPHASWPRLPESSAEAQAVAALLPSKETRLCLRAQATLAELDAALGGATHRWRVIHLACHGVFVPDSPGASGLVLGGGEILSPYGALRRRFDADLVTLSACETGRGVVRVGDGVDGLVRTLFVAGTPRVMVAGWRIPDEGTRTFMEAFYRAWLDDGLAPAAALRRAKLDALRSADRTHPACWAAFTLWGLPD